MTAKQAELLAYLRTEIERTGVCPSFEEMKAAIGLKAKSGIHRLILALEERGAIVRIPGQRRGIVVADADEVAVRAIPTAMLVTELSRRRAALEAR